MHDFVLASAKICLALLFFLLPGLLVTNLVGLAPSRIHVVPISFALGMILLTLLNVILFALHGNISWLTFAWLALSSLLTICLLRNKTRANRASAFQPELPDSRSDKLESFLNASSLAMIAALVVALLIVPTYLGGEEEIELIITRKLLENEQLALDNINYIPNFTATYLLTPFYLFRAFVSQIAGLDPVLIHFRMSFLPTILSILTFCALAHELGASRRLAQCALFVVPLHVMFASLSILDQSPFLLSPSTFFRGSFSPQVNAPLCLLFMILCIKHERHSVYYGILFVCMFFTAVVTQATASLFLLVLLSLAICSLLFVLKSARVSDFLRSAPLKRVIVLLAVSVSFLIVYKHFVDLYHPETEVLEYDFRQYLKSVLLNALSDPLSLILKRPETVIRFKYNFFQGVPFEQIGLQTLSAFTPPVVAGWLCAGFFVLFKRNFVCSFMVAVLCLLPLLVCVPWLSTLALLLNQYVFTNWSHLLSVFYYLNLFLVGGIVADSIARIAFTDGTRMFVAKLISVIFVAAFVSYFFVGGLTLWIANYLKGDYSETLALGVFYFGLFALLAVKWFGKISREWSLDFRGIAPTVIMIALLLPILNRNYELHGRCLADVVPLYMGRWTTNLSMYEQYTQHIWTKANLTPGLFECLMFVRHSIPANKIFAADPAVIRTIPLLTNQHIVHSGVPFGFVEKYFLRYYKANVKDGDLLTPFNRQVVFEREDPFFQPHDRLSPESLHNDMEFVRDFHVEYILFTPEYYDDAFEIFAKLAADSSLLAEKIYDKDRYAIYRVGSSTAIRQFR